MNLSALKLLEKLELAKKSHEEQKKVTEEAAGIIKSEIEPFRYYINLIWLRTSIESEEIGVWRILSASGSRKHKKMNSIDKYLVSCCQKFRKTQNCNQLKKYLTKCDKEDLHDGDVSISG
eukprot:gene11738-5076_t